MSNQAYTQDLIQLGKTIRDLRELFKMSQTRLAKEAGVSRCVIADIEQEKRFPNTLTLLKLCRIFGITPAELCAATFSHWRTITNRDRALIHKSLSNSMDKIVTDAAIRELRRA